MVTTEAATVETSLNKCWRDFMIAGSIFSSCKSGKVLKIARAGLVDEAPPMAEALREFTLDDQEQE
jgi:hypothetical protein